jgi:hypothetical protein
VSVSVLFGSVAVAESAIAEPSVPAAFATVTVGGVFTSTAAVAVVLPSSSSVTVTVTVFGPTAS